VQYLSLVWIYNRNRVEKDSSIGGFMRFIFRRSGSLVGLYIGLVFAYGSLAYFNSRIEIDTIKRVLTGVVAASSLLHFYYDGFIWKVREKSTRESLGLTGGTTAAAANEFLPSWALHGLKWVAVFVLPLTAFWFGQTRGPAPEAERESWVVADLPVGARQRINYGIALQKAGRMDEAAEQYHIALRSEPNSAKAHYNLAGVLMAQAKIDNATEHFAQALRCDPGAGGDYRYYYAYALERLGRDDEAREQYEAAIKSNPKSALYHYGFAGHLAKLNRVDEAVVHFREAVRLKPDYSEAHWQLGNALLAKNELEEAKAHYLETVRLEPNRADVRNSLGSIYYNRGEISQAIVQYQEALRLNPQFSEAEENLRVARASETRFQSRSPQ
jgi:Tfp pilus assembly protein PilF